MDPAIEKECAALALLFQQIISDMKSSTPVWEDFATKAMRLHVTLRSVVTAAAAFLEAFQKVADMATNTRGATRDIGSALTRLCMRHRNIEGRLKTITSAILEMLVAPLQERMDDWKKIVTQLDKEHSKESKKAHQELRKSLSDASRLQKKVKKGRADVQGQLDAAIVDLRQKVCTLQEVEKNSVRSALVEERGRYCLFIGAIKPLIDGEISLFSDATHLQEIMDSLCNQAAEPASLPVASEQVIVDISGTSFSWPSQSPPRSPAMSVTSSKSSLSSLSSASASQSPVHRARTNSESSACDSDTESVSSRPVSAAMPSSPHTTSCMHVYNWPAGSTGNIPGGAPVGPCGPLGAGPMGSPRQTGSPSSPAHLVRRQESGGGAANQPSPPLAYLDSLRPHTISTAYERSHVRSALTSQTFEPPAYRPVGMALSQPTTPCPYVGGLPLHHRSLAMFTQQRSQPNGMPSHNRDLQLDELLARTSRGGPVVGPSVDGSLQQQQPQQQQRGPDSEDIQQRTDSERDSRCFQDRDSERQQTCIETVKSLTEAIKRLEANARDATLDGTQAGPQRSLQHSVSCGTIIVDQRAAGSLANGNHRDAMEAIARRSSMYIPTWQQQQQQQHQQQQLQPVRRTASMVVPAAMIDQMMARYSTTDDNVNFLDMTQSDIIDRSSGGILDGMSRSCSALPQEPHMDDDDDDACFFDDGFLLPPSPFRSPDFNGGSSENYGPVLPYQQPSETAANNGCSAPSEIPYAIGNGEKGRHGVYQMNEQQMRQRNAAAGRPNDGNFLWMTLPSPDDVTPTNENQPQGFWMQSMRAPSSGIGGNNVPQGLESSRAVFNEDEACSTVRYSNL